MKPWLPLVPILAACTGEDGPAAAIAHFDHAISVAGDLLVSDGALYLQRDQRPDVAPEVRFLGARGGWVMGIDVANNGGGRDYVVAAKADWPRPGDVNDLVYVAHNAERAPTVGIGVTPPTPDYRLAVSAQDDQPDMGGLLVRRTPAQTAPVIAAIDSAGAPRWWMDAGFWFQGAHPAAEASLAIKADALRGRPLVVAKADGSSPYGFQYADDASGELFVRYFPTATNNLVLSPTGRPTFPAGLTATRLRVTDGPVPASASAPCERGELSYDQDHVYVCVATNTWKRSALTTW